MDPSWTHVVPILDSSWTHIGLSWGLLELSYGLSYGHQLREPRMSSKCVFFQGKCSGRLSFRSPTALLPTTPAPLKLALFGEFAERAPSCPGGRAERRSFARRRRRFRRFVMVHGPILDPCRAQHGLILGSLGLSWSSLMGSLMGTNCESFG